MALAGLLRVLSCRLAFFRWKNQQYRGINVESVQSDVVYRQITGPSHPPPGNDNTIEDSTTWGAGARILGDPAPVRPAKHGTFGTALAYSRGKMPAFSDRLARIACGSVISGQIFQHYRGLWHAPRGERHPYRGWRPDPLQMPRVGGVFKAGSPGSREVAPCLGATCHILVVICRPVWGGSFGTPPEREHYRGWRPDPLQMQRVGEVSPANLAHSRHLEGVRPPSSIVFAFWGLPGGFCPAPPAKRPPQREEYRILQKDANGL